MTAPTDRVEAIARGHARAAGADEDRFWRSYTGLAVDGIAADPVTARLAELEGLLADVPDVLQRAREKVASLVILRMGVGYEPMHPVLLKDIDDLLQRLGGEP